MGKIWNADLEDLPSHARLTQAFDGLTDELALQILRWLADNGEVVFERRSNDGKPVFYVYLTELPEADEKTGRTLFCVETPLDEVFGAWSDAEPDEYLAVAERLEHWAAKMRRRAAEG